MSIRYVLPSAFALAIALGLSLGQVQAAEGDMGPGATTPKMDTPGAAPEMGTPGARPNAMEERPGQSSAQPQGAPGKSTEGSEGNLPAQRKSAQEDKPSEGKMTEQPKANEGAAGTEGKTGKMTEGQPGAASEGKTGATTEGKAGATSEGKTGVTTEGKAETQNSTGKSVKLESQQVSKVKSYFTEHKPSVQRIEKSRVSVSIGVALPATVSLYDLPPDVIVVGGACPIKYFVWGDDLVLVDSCTRHVVEIIPGIA
jgi:uncharacterized protein DUF1236